MKSLMVVLVILFLFLQYKLWFADGSLPQVLQLKKAVNTVTVQNQQLQDRNKALAADVNDLKHGNASVEEHARTELGMIQKDETFYQIIEVQKK